MKMPSRYVVLYQMKSVQWLQKVGCLKKRAVNWWSFTSTIRLCFRAPFLWNTGTLGGGERGEGRGEVPAERGEVGEARFNGESIGDGETGVDIMPGGDSREKCIMSVRKERGKESLNVG